MDNRETSYSRLERLATVEFRVALSRQSQGSGFVDTIALELSPTMDDIPGRREFAQACLDMVNYTPVREDLYYVPQQAVPEDEHSSKLFKDHEGRVYATDNEYVDRVLKAIAERVHLLLNHPYSQCTHVSVAGLDYFDSLKVMKSGMLSVISNSDLKANPVFNSLNLGI